MIQFALAPFVRPLRWCMFVLLLLSNGRNQSGFFHFGGLCFVFFTKNNCKRVATAHLCMPYVYVSFLR